MRVRRRSSQGYQFTSDAMAPGARRGEGEEIPDEGGQEREAATTFTAPGVWWISEVNSEIMQVGVVGEWTKAERLWRVLKLGVDDQLSHGTCIPPAQMFKITYFYF